jgi:hypothetical protein
MAAALAAAALTPLTTAPASAGPSGLQGDFDGDGYRDVAVAAPAATVAGKSWAGQVAVVYGDANGLNTARRTLISQNSPGVPGSAETDDMFGDRIAAADLDRDGYCDLIVGARYEKTGELEAAGTVVVIWGSRTGLSGGTTVRNPYPLTGSYFGLGIAAADFTGDGRPDLAVAAQGDSGTSPFKIRLIRGPFTRSGTTGKVSAYAPGIDWPDLTAGRVSGDTKADLVVTGSKPSHDAHRATAVYYRGTSDGLAKAASLRAASTAAIGDLDKDGHGDIVLGNPAEPDSEPSASTGGKIHVIYGTGSGPSSTRRVTYTQNTSGIPGSAAYGDEFGGALTIGDFNGNGHNDLAVGAPGDADPGSITLLKGSSSGITTKGAVRLTQDSAGIPDMDEWGDGFGSALLASDIDRDGRADLTAVGVGENSPAGAAWYLPAAAATGSFTFAPTKLGLSSAQGGAFGRELAG